MTWRDVLKETWQSPWFAKLLKEVDIIEQQKPVYPPKEERFNALNLTPYDDVKMVILGQDPYHQKHQAMGLCFSVRKGIKIPPSLENIYKELQTDVGLAHPNHGDLTEWAQRGILLLNTTLTVEDSSPMSHKDLGWEIFTDAVITALNQKETPVVFMLWGKHAQSKTSLIKNTHHLILKAPHPSPLSAHRGFLGCQHFSKANAFLTKHGYLAINYQITP